MIELTPPPADVADLLIQMTRLDWPTTEEDRRHYFGTLGLHDSTLCHQAAATSRTP